MMFLKATEHSRALYALPEESGAQRLMPHFSEFPNASEDSRTEIFALSRSNLIMVVGRFPCHTSEDATALLFYILCITQMWPQSEIPFKNTFLPFALYLREWPSQ